MHITGIIKTTIPVSEMLAAIQKKIRIMENRNKNQNDPLTAGKFYTMSDDKEIVSSILLKFINNIKSPEHLYRFAPKEIANLLIHERSKFKADRFNSFQDISAIKNLDKIVSSVRIEQSIIKFDGLHRTETNTIIYSLNNRKDANI